MTPAVIACCLFLQGLTLEVIEHAQAGVAALQQGRFSLAIQEFRKVTELQPESASGYANLGVAYFQNRQYREAIPELEHALRINPNLVGTHQTLGVILLVQGNAEGALPHLEKTRAPELLGLAYLETGRLGSAIVALQGALDRQPNDPDLLYCFGRATALASKRTADQLKAIDPNLAYQHAAAGDGDSRSQRGLVSLQKALADQPDDAGLLLAFSLESAGASRKAFEQVLQSNADSARAHQILAERHVEGGHLAEAEREYAESLRLKPYTANVHLALGGVFAAEGKWPAAVAQFRAETALRPASPDAFYRLGAIFLQQGQAHDALEEFASADRVRPDTPQILLALGKAALAANDLARAEASWKKLLAVEDASEVASSAHLELAALYRRAGKMQEADREMAAYKQLMERARH